MLERWHAYQLRSVRTAPFGGARTTVRAELVPSFMPSSDDLLTAARSGDARALAELIEQHRHGVYRYGLQVCRTTEDAEDAVQETLWAATRAIRAFRGSASSIVSWMFTIVRRECLRLIDGRRRGTAALSGSEDEFPDALPDPEDSVAMRRRTELLADALGALEPAYREVVLLRDIEELSAPEAAARLGISVDALKSRLHRARVTLRDYVRARAESF
jgi:RNA polymerase sigma-70 factor (ECF subfamily)